MEQKKFTCFLSLIAISVMICSCLTTNDKDVADTKKSSIPVENKKDNGSDKDEVNKKNETEYDENGYDKEGYDKKGFDKNGIHKVTKTKYDEEGYGKDGYNENGYDRNGNNITGWN